MFTLKLYRRMPDLGPGVPCHKMHKVITVHHVVVMEIGQKGQALELWAVKPDQSYDTYYIGETEAGMEAHGRDDLHLGVDSGSWWGWGLLENEKGSTTEHYRPASYGIPS